MIIWKIYSKAFSKALDIPIYTIKDLENLDKIPEIDSKNYQTYVDNYIKFPGSRDIFSWQIISDYLRNI